MATRREVRARKKQKENRKKRFTFSTVVLLAALSVFLFSAFQLFRIFSEYREGDKVYDQVRKHAVKDVGDGAEQFTVDFTLLKEMNPDTVAWLRFDSPSVISYPVLQGEDNKRYLHETFEGRKNKLGAIFMDANNAGDFTDRNTFIYGHRMKNGSMFGKLEEYGNKDFSRKHPYFYIYTPDGKKSTYQVFAAGVVTDTSDAYTISFNTDKEFLAYIEQERRKSNYETEVEVNGDSEIVSLSTCTRSSDEHRFLVHGVKIKEEPVNASGTSGQPEE